MDQLAADAINKVFVAALIQQIDDALVQKLDHQNPTLLLQTKLERLKDLLQQVGNGFDQQTLTPAETLRDCLQSTRDAIRLATRIICRVQKKRRCIDFITCAPKMSREIREWNTIFDKLFQDLEFDLSVWISAQQIVHEFVSLQSVPEPDVLLQPVPHSGFVGSKIKFAEAQLQTWLTEDPNNGVIAVYGIRGVGKTSLLKTIYNSQKVSSVFDLVIWVTVSRNYTIPDLQCRIAESIDLDLSSKSRDIDLQKMKLYAFLKKKKFLLILDDIWRPLDLQELGIGFGEDKGSKVVFATSIRDMALMEAEESTEVEPLTKDEGWEMFERVAFRGGQAPDELKEYARLIADQCAGLPVAISVVAGEMRGKTTLDEWNALAFQKCKAFFSTYFESYNLLSEDSS
jgi:hypothetical protein